MSEQLSYMTALHVRLLRILEGIGFELLEEVSLPPYMVDCYCSTYHIAFEADGPQHSIKHDKERDEYLWRVYHLPIIRFSMDDIDNHKELVKLRAIDAAMGWKFDVKSRAKLAAENAPWI